jgi:hypothetical protein
MASRPKTGTQIYYYFLSKSPDKRISTRFPSGAPMKRDVHLQSLFYLSSRVPSKGALPPGSLYRAPIERDVPPPELLSTISQSALYMVPLPGSPAVPL